MNNFLNGLQDAANFTYTENHAVARRSTKSALLDMFSLGGAYRSRSDEDCIFLFKKAYDENPTYALKCLFYFRDIRGGQGQRRFFRTCMKWLATYNTEAARRNLEYIAEYGRWDDFYCFVGTPLEKEMFQFLKRQLALDVQCKTPSLLAKWLKSENASSKETRALGEKTRMAFGMTAKQYRKTLSILRERINVLERLMSENRWDEIEYDKIPSRAGLIYKNAFARHDIERIKAGAKTYAEFAADKTTTVNAGALYPYEVVAKAIECMHGDLGWCSRRNAPAMDGTNRLMINKYWDNLTDYFQNAVFNGMAIVDTSGSMCGPGADAPINVAVSLGMYCAERAKGPFANHFMTFSNIPTLVTVTGIDFCDKVARIVHNAEWGMSTNIEAAFDLLLDTALKNNCTQDEIPQNLIVISDMEFNACVTSGPSNRWRFCSFIDDKETLFESMAQKWEAHGYQMPRLTFWNVNARHDLISMKDDGYVRYVSGMSPVIYEQIMKDLSAYDLMMDKLDSERYKDIK